MLQFARLYPLDQRDYPLERKPLDFGPLMPRGAKIENPSRDYTPPSKFLLAIHGGDKNEQNLAAGSFYSVPDYEAREHLELACLKQVLMQAL